MNQPELFLHECLWAGLEVIEHDPALRFDGMDREVIAEHDEHADAGAGVTYYHRGVVINGVTYLVEISKLPENV